MNNASVVIYDCDVGMCNNVVILLLVHVEILNIFRVILQSTVLAP